MPPTRRPVMAHAGNGGPMTHLDQCADRTPHDCSLCRVAEELEVDAADIRRWIAEKRIEALARIDSPDEHQFTCDDVAALRFLRDASELPDESWLLKGVPEAERAAWLAECLDDEPLVLG